MGSLSEIKYLIVAKVADKDKNLIELFTINRDSRVDSKTYDISEVLFKANLQSGVYDKAASILAGGKLIGQSIVSYVTNSGFPDVALQFTDFSADPAIYFNLALKAFDFEKCFDAANKLNDPNVIFN